MLANSFKATALGIFVAFGLNIHAQNIIIDDELASHSEPLKVKMGSQGFGKIWKYRFGEYAVVESKNKVSKTTYKSNFFNTKTDVASSHKFSFSLCNAIPDSAFVMAATDIEIKTIQGFELFAGFTIGDDMLLSENHNFTASIIINSDTSDVWYLIMNSEAGSESADTETAVLLGNENEIQVYPTSSNINNSDKRMFPALGYELFENDQACAAVQYYGGGALGSNKNIVWIRNELDHKRKLILAAALTAIMQHQFDNSVLAE
jgi:hypothetical protein